MIGCLIYVLIYVIVAVIVLYILEMILAPLITLPRNVWVLLRALAGLLILLWALECFGLTDYGPHRFGLGPRSGTSAPCLGS
jgi:hypothetical protein